MCSIPMRDEIKVNRVFFEIDQQFQFSESSDKACQSPESFFKL